MDSCVVLLRSESRRFAWNNFRKKLSAALGRTATDRDVYYILLAYLNSSVAEELLTTGRKPTPRGSYAVNDQYFKDFLLPDPTAKMKPKSIINRVKKLRSASADQITILRSELDRLVVRSYR